MFKKQCFHFIASEKRVHLKFKVERFTSSAISLQHLNVCKLSRVPLLRQIYMSFHLIDLTYFISHREFKRICYAFFFFFCFFFFFSFWCLNEIIAHFIGICIAGSWLLIILTFDIFFGFCFIQIDFLPIGRTCFFFSNNNDVAHGCGISVDMKEKALSFNNDMNILNVQQSYIYFFSWICNPFHSVPIQELKHQNRLLI